MTHAAKRLLRIALTVIVTAGCLFGSADFSFVRMLSGTQSLVSEAQAIIGRPVTPVSYAGVARRSVRRGFYR
jgi:hypothetical protein